MASKNPYIKRSHVPVEYTPELVHELLRCSTDPVYFIRNYVKIQHPVLGVVPFDLYEYQENLVKNFLSGRMNIVLSARQTGKALALNTPIPTPYGWTTMGKIQVGDIVLGSNGRPTAVTFVTEVMNNHGCYDVHFSDGEYLTADANHLWSVYDSDTEMHIVISTQQMAAAQFTRGDKSPRYHITNAEPIQFPTAVIPDPYQLGRSLMTVDCNSPDSVNRIPKEYLRADIEQRTSLLQGIMDQCGIINKEKHRCELPVSTHELSDDIFELMCTLGLSPSFIKKTEPFVEFNSTKIVFVPHLECVDLFRDDEKIIQQRTRFIQTSPHRTITLISYTESVPVRCITVDSPNHLFLAGKNMVPTHNSTVSAAYLLWFSMFHEDKTVLIVSNKNDNAMEMITRIRFAYENLPMWLKPGITDDGWNKHNVGFDNGSRIVSQATSENSGRGMSISLLFCDEFAFVVPGIQESFWTSISPTLATGGSCIIASTPNGDSNLFAQLWRGAELKVNGFLASWIKWDEPPGRDEIFKQQEIAKIGELKWRQEYECCSINTMTEVKFPSGLIVTMSMGELYDLLHKASNDPSFLLEKSLC
jgi:hypothetical protein